uniref:RING-type domain-containing protein n=1 Tax=Mimiviridae sp. ChoanoV1 TaxID=2596887 RepID=A0A5B8IIC0_9VIRU|nr:hypothetical protein 6_27 [Mimiviridae sp. ChoanoV1]
MSLIPNKEFTFDGDINIEEMRLFDTVNFPNVLLIKKKLVTQQTSKYYLFDTIKNKDIYVFPRDKYPLSGTFVGLSNKMIYDSSKQILTYLTIYHNSPQIGGNKILLEKIKLSYQKFNFKTETLNTIELTYPNNNETYNLESLPGTDYLILFPSKPNRLVIFDFKKLEIIMEFSNKYLPFSHLRPQGILFLSDNLEVTIYDYINNKELQNIVNRHTPNPQGTKNNIKIELKGEYYIIKDGLNSTFYKFIKEDDIPDENKCVVCFSKTERKNVLVPCGHTQFCSKCVKENMETCPLCRANIEKVIKIY